MAQLTGREMLEALYAALGDLLGSDDEPGAAPTKRTRKAAAATPDPEPEPEPEGDGDEGVDTNSERYQELSRKREATLRKLLLDLRDEDDEPVYTEKALEGADKEDLIVTIIDYESSDPEADFDAMSLAELTAFAKDAGYVAKDIKGMDEDELREFLAAGDDDDGEDDDDDDDDDDDGDDGDDVEITEADLKDMEDDDLEKVAKSVKVSIPAKWTPRSRARVIAEIMEGAEPDDD